MPGLAKQLDWAALLRRPTLSGANSQRANPRPIAATDYDLCSAGPLNQASWLMSQWIESDISGSGSERIKSAPHRT